MGPRVLISLLLAVSILPLPALAAETGWLIASQSESIAADRPLELQLIRPDEQVSWPALLHLRLIGDDGAETRIALHPVAEADGMRRRYAGNLEHPPSGTLRAELVEVKSNRLALLVADTRLAVEPLGVTQPITLAPSPDLPAEEAEQQTKVLEDTQLPALSVNEPIYFVVAGDGEARFQLSFNYRLFAPEGAVVKFMPLLKGLYFGYTQNSFWDLGGKSKPFRDTSYRPSLYWQGKLEGPSWLPQSWKSGYEHESNGKDAEDSRSIDTLFLEPKWQKEFADGHVLTFNPRIRAYLDKSENPDIQRYRGYVNWGMQYGRDAGWKFAANYLEGTAGYATVQLDASYPLGTEVFSNIGSFVHFQYFSGYGETLLDYDSRKSDQFRIGISIVR